MLRTALGFALLFVAVPAWADSGAQDAFGYIVRSSTDGGSAYDYTRLSDGAYILLDDEDARIVQLPFPFTFYGVTYNEVEVHSNGALTFGAQFALGFDHDCGDLATTTPTIWAWYDDLDPSEAEITFPVPGTYRATVGTGADRYFAVEWYRIPLFELTDPLSFQVKLFEADGRIEVHYEDTLTSDAARSSGLRAVVGTTGGADPLVFSCDEAALSNGLALTFYPPCDDVDGDGFCPGPAPDPEDRDCDDADPDVHPGADERCNELDDDCDGDVPDDEFDRDEDGERGCEGDCDDADDQRHSGADELCNGLDDDCDGTPGDDEQDADRDGQTACEGDCDDQDAARSGLDTDGDGESSCDGDCDDEDADVSTGATERCDGIDNDCDGGVDDLPECSDAAGGVPYGCLVRCSSTSALPSGSALLLAAVAAGLIRRRRADPEP